MLCEHVSHRVFSKPAPSRFHILGDCSPGVSSVTSPYHSGGESARHNGERQKCESVVASPLMYDQGPSPLIETESLDNVDIMCAAEALLKVRGSLDHL